MQLCANALVPLMVLRLCPLQQITCSLDQQQPLMNLSFWTDVHFESDHMGLEDSDELIMSSQN